MKIEERSYSSKILRPKPTVHLEEDGSILVVATAWGQPEHAQKVVEHVSKYVGAAKADVEVTSPFEFLTCLPDEVNYLRTAILIANEELYRGENRAEYFSGVEVLVLYQKQNQIAWAQVGSPGLLLKRQGMPLQPLSTPLDLSTELSTAEGRLAPLPSQLLGLDPTCDIKVGHLHSQPGDRLMLMAGSRLANSLWVPGLQEPQLTEITRHMVNENPDLPFWLGVVDLDQDRGA